jgi:acylpyruvate hydrolase
MRLATIRTGAGTTAARLDGDALIPLDAADVGELLAAAHAAGAPLAGAPGPGQDGGAAALPERHGADPVPLAEADYAPVVPSPGKVICVGHNYRSHIAEMGHEPPRYPTLFTKFADTLTGPNDDLVLPSISEKIDWEVELAVIVGSPVYRATPAQAQAAIAGYAVSNDVSMRDWQRRTPQWAAGKMFQSTTPVGPFLVTPDEVGHARDLEIRCEVDGQIMQQGRTSDLLFSPADVIAYASQAVTLRPGDLILTGTTGGVGDARTPPTYLSPGQVLRTYVEGLGECVNHCVAEKADG